MFCFRCTVGFVLFFFFQAEDGIRDLTVTGVQTCALPILPALFRLTKKVATPLTAATGVVPLSALPPGLLPSAMATASLNPVATFPKASSARTFTAGLIWRFATVVPGSVPNTRSEEHTSELQSQSNLVCRLLLEKKKHKLQ